MCFWPYQVKLTLISENLNFFGFTNIDSAFLFTIISLRNYAFNLKLIIQNILFVMKVFKIKFSWQQGFKPRLNRSLAQASSIKNQNSANNVDSMTGRKVDFEMEADS